MIQQENKAKVWLYNSLNVSLFELYIYLYEPFVSTHSYVDKFQSIYVSLRTQEDLWCIQTQDLTVLISHRLPDT